MPTNTQKLTPAGQSPVLALALGSAAWLRAQADNREEMLHALGEEGERETKREILGMRDAATQLDRVKEMEELLRSACAIADRKEIRERIRLLSSPNQ